MKPAIVLMSIFFIGICHAYFSKDEFNWCVEEKLGSTEINVDNSMENTVSDQSMEENVTYYDCSCDPSDPSTDLFCVEPNKCMKDSIPDNGLKDTQPDQSMQEPAIYHNCSCDPSTDQFCIAPDKCVNQTIVNAVLTHIQEFLLSQLSPDQSTSPEEPAIYHKCSCNPSTDKFCIAPDKCVKDSTRDDLLTMYKECGASAANTEIPHGEIGGRCYEWRYCNGEARCDENYKCVPHACKKEGEIPSGPDDKCCMPMVTHKGEPCKLLNTDHSGPCNSHRQCQLDNEGRDYVCCYKDDGGKDPSCVLNKDCPKFRLVSEWYNS